MLVQWKYEQGKDVPMGGGEVRGGRGGRVMGFKVRPRHVGLGWVGRVGCEGQQM